MLFTKATQDTVINDLLPAYVEGNLANVCSSPDEMRFKAFKACVQRVCALLAHGIAWERAIAN